MNSIIYLEGKTIFADNPDFSEMIFELVKGDNDIKQIVCRKVFPVSDVLYLQRQHDGYYGFENVDKINVNGILFDPKIFNTEIFLTYNLFWCQAILYPIDPKLPMAVNAVVFAYEKLHDFIKNTPSQGQIKYDGSMRIQLEEIQKLY